MELNETAVAITVTDMRKSEDIITSPLKKDSGPIGILKNEEMTHSTAMAAPLTLTILGRDAMLRLMEIGRTAIQIRSTTPKEKAVTLSFTTISEADPAEINMSDDARACDIKKAGTRARFSTADVNKKSLSADVVDMPPV
jgi:hypothetical protein